MVLLLLLFCCAVRHCVLLHVACQVNQYVTRAEELKQAMKPKSSDAAEDSLPMQPLHELGVLEVFVQLCIVLIFFFYILMLKMMKFRCDPH